MNAKYVFALILVLQVSTSLCEVREPSPELLAKYNDLKDTFRRRLANAYTKLTEVAGAQIEGNSDAAAVKTKLDELHNKEEFKAFLQVVSNMYGEVSPYVDQARSAVLGAYEENARPYIGEHLNNIIDVAKAYLDKVMPAQ